MDTVAVEARPTLLRRPCCGSAAPIAAPSANLFSRPSPTRAAHVLADLDGRIDIVLDAGPVDIGVESTVVDLTTVPPTVLRPGAIGIEQLRDILPDVQLRTKAVTSNDTPMPSPGLLSQHYAPHSLTLYPRTPSAGPESFVAHVREVLATGKRVGVLATTEDASALRTLPVVIAELGSEAQAEAVAARLYAALRELDASEVDVILAHDFPTDAGLWRALRDRLRRIGPQVGRVLLDPPDMRRGRVFGLGGPGLSCRVEGPGLRLVGSRAYGLRQLWYAEDHPIATATPLRTELDRLAGFGPTTWPVLSLYLDMRPDQSGRRNRHLSSQGVPGASRTLHGDARKSFERDVQRIHAYVGSRWRLRSEAWQCLPAPAQMASSSRFNLPPRSTTIRCLPGLFPISIRWHVQLTSARVPALLVDTNSARLFVFRLGRRDAQEQVTNVKTRRGAFGGASQARYQRHCDNFYLLHRRRSSPPSIASSAPKLSTTSSSPLTRRRVRSDGPASEASRGKGDSGAAHLPVSTPEHDVLAETLDAMRQHDAKTDAERVQTMIDASAAEGAPLPARTRHSTLLRRGRSKS